MKKDQSTTQAFDSNDHKAVIVLLDSYSTDELTYLEKALVEHHLVSCQECQYMLTDISHLHTLLKLPENDLRSPMLHEYSLTPTYRRNVSLLADSILDRITLMGGEHTPATLSSSIVAQQPVRFVSLREKARYKNRLRWVVGLAAAVMCIALLNVLFFSAISQFISKNKTGVSVDSTSQPPIWMFQQDQVATTIRQGQNIFAVEFIPIVNNSEFGIIYAYRSSHPGTLPHIEVDSILPYHQGSSITIPDHIQSLGTIGEFEIGIIYMHVQNRVKQSIVLQGTFPEQPNLWHLTLCTQMTTLPTGDSSSGGEYGAFIVDQKNLPELIMRIPDVTDKKAYVATHTANLLSLTLSSIQKAPTTNQSLYIRLDYLLSKTPVQATVISQADFIHLAGPQPTHTNCGTCHPVNQDQLRKMFNATETATVKK
ncbi:hypothetical protein [Dictyobacter arantiisoli]|uniref:Zinc-finger domain-containing protein n=1 Tax=Dictyobacter arantiisoli TaxID=2014874 RepID=A0A5A5TF04_9CHLR|nr:hypothetical protein [Dictyobacter arantiisoli]GCF09726.1 hypothetical protein KDI_32900 [Dictyobacter arantiisoli]